MPITVGFCSHPPHRAGKEKGSVRYYGKDGWNNLIRVDYHGSKEVPKGTCHVILKDAGIKR